MVDCEACNGCICQYVCGDNVKLYSGRCMRAMRVFDSKGLKGNGDKKDKPESGTGESVSQFRKWIKEKLEVNPYYAHGMDVNVLEEIWLFAQNNNKTQKCKMCNSGAVHHYCNSHKPWSPT